MSTSVLGQVDETPTGAAEDGWRAAVVDAAIDLYRRHAIDDVSVEDAAAAVAEAPSAGTPSGYCPCY